VLGNISEFFSSAKVVIEGRRKRIRKDTIIDFVKFIIINNLKKIV
jgi:hypothetical protein